MTRIVFTALTSALVLTTASMADEHHNAGHEGSHAHEAETPAAEARTEELAAALAAGGSLVSADVLGMVCDFCAVAMTRTFGRRDEVAAVHVDLDAKTLQIVIREGQTLSDETIEDLVRRSGYELSAIQRGEPA